MVEHERQTNTMNIFFDSAMIHARKVVIDNMHYIADVKATTGDLGSNEDRAFSGTEGTSQRT